jgi:cytochrome c5
MDYARRKKQLRTLLAAGAFSLCLGSCYYDKYAELHPALQPAYCDTSSVVSYSRQVAPILSQYCTSCHNAKNPSGSVTLDTYNGTVSAAVSGKLLGCIQHAQGYNAMPLSGQLDACYIREIQLWILHKEPNN